LAFSAALLGLATNGWASGEGFVALKDPTRPLQSSGGQTMPHAERPRPILASLLVGPDRRIAVIDGMAMIEGQQAAGVKVWKIHADGVLVSVDGAPRTKLTLKNADIRKEMR